MLDGEGHILQQIDPATIFDQRPAKTEILEILKRQVRIHYRIYLSPHISFFSIILL